MTGHPARIAKKKAEILVRLPKSIRDIAWKVLIRSPGSRGIIDGAATVHWCPTPTPEPATIPTLQATADDSHSIAPSHPTAYPIPTQRLCHPKRRHFDRRRRTCSRSGEIRFSTPALISSETKRTTSSHLQQPRRGQVNKERRLKNRKPANRELIFKAFGSCLPCNIQKQDSIARNRFSNLAVPTQPSSITRGSYT